MTDFILHAGVSFFLMLMFGFVYEWKKGYVDLINLSCIVFSFGLAKELYDLFDYGLFSLTDLEHDFVGIALAFILFVYVGES